MTQNRLYPHWKEIVVFAAEGPQPQMLMETKKSRAMIAGLEPGQKVTPHPEGPAIYHFLEGTGRMIAGEEQFAVQTGATVVVPDGVSRGIEAKTQLAFLAVRVA
jgi:mannose-6-phosphate isomerase-like protein (cupin superfamily)